MPRSLFQVAGSGDIHMAVSINRGPFMWVSLIINALLLGPLVGNSYLSYLECVA